MKAFTLLAVLFSLLLIIAACGGNSDTSSSNNSNDDTSSSNESSSGDESAEEIKLKVATYFAGTSPIYYGFIEPWMERVTELTEGQVQFDYYPSEQLGKAADLLELTKTGVTDIGIVVPDYNPDTMPLSVMLMNFPNLSENVHQGTMAMNKLVRENEQLVEIDYSKNGIHPIMSIVPPGDDIWTVNKEIRVPDDLIGLKLRTKGGMTNSLYEKLGVTSIAIAFPEIYEAVERGVVDGATTYNMAIKNAGLEELLTYSTPLHLGTSGQTLAINSNVWEELPESAKEAFLQAADEVTSKLGEIYGVEIKEFMEKFEQNGTVVELTDEEKQQWVDIFNEWGEEWLAENKDKGLPYEEVLEDYRKYLAEFK